MTDITILDDVSVELVSKMGDDHAIANAARVSLLGQTTSEDKDAGLINYLASKHHGSPFEHTSLTFYVKAPIFVFREFHRHRIGFSYNEMSGRYTELLPEFYIPKDDRPLVNVGTSANPSFSPGSTGQKVELVNSLLFAYRTSWAEYKRLLHSGVANEIARVVLPVGIFSQMYVTCNARSLMAFLTLRTKYPEGEALFPSNPQHEISLVADKMEEIFGVLFPLTHSAFIRNGRVAP